MSTWLSIDTNRNGGFALYSNNNDSACCGENRTESFKIKDVGIDEAFTLIESGVNDDTKWRTNPRDSVIQSYFMLYPHKRAAWEENRRLKGLPLFELAS